MRIRSLINEAHRRSLWQVLAIYVLGAWAAYEMIDAVTDRLGLPDWVPGFAIVLFLIGLPIVVATAFVQEGLPGGAPLAGPADPTLVPGLDRGEPATDRRAGAAILTPAVPHAFLTWQRAVLAGIVAFLLLGLTAGGYIGLRNAGVGPFASLITSGAMSTQDRLVIAQFEHAAGDSVTAAAITEALRVDLAQSRVLTVVESRFISDALQRMGRSRDAHLDAALATEVAVREGAKAVLVGEIAPVGTSWVITARLLHAASGEQLYSRRENAAGSSDLIGAVDRLSQKLREAIGESLRTVRADAPLEAVTTSSLTALQKYTQGVTVLDVERDYDRATQLLEEALAADSTFAMAWRKLAVAYYNTDAGVTRIERAATRAYELRDRLTERERYHTIAFYHLNVTYDNAAAANAYRSILDAYPNDHAALNNIALVYGDMRDAARAVEYYRRAIAVDSFAASSWSNLLQVEYGLGHRDEAKSLLDHMMQLFPGQRDNVASAILLAAAEQQYDEAERMLRQLWADSRGSNVWLARTGQALAHLMLMRGRGREAQQYLAQSAEAQIARGVHAAMVSRERMIASAEAIMYGRPQQAVRRLDALLASADWRDAGLTDREQLHVAYEYARAGNAAAARRLAAEWDAAPRELRGDPMWQRDGVDGWIALAEDRPGDAIPALRKAAAWGPCEMCSFADLARAFDAAGVADSAIAYYRRYIEMPYLARLYGDALDLPIAHERLAELYESRGDIANAREYASRFVELWKNADPELQPRVRRMEERLQRLMER